jgi:hypothetical protein
MIVRYWGIYTILMRLMWLLEALNHFSFCIFRQVKVFSIDWSILTLSIIRYISKYWRISGIWRMFTDRFWSIIAHSEETAFHERHSFQPEETPNINKFLFFVIIENNTRWRIVILQKCQKTNTSSLMLTNHN